MTTTFLRIASYSGRHGQHKLSMMGYLKAKQNVDTKLGAGIKKKKTKMVVDLGGAGGIGVNMAKIHCMNFSKN